jgi:hypothetical protein
MSLVQRHELARRAALALNVVAVSTFLLVVLNRSYPIVGHDYSYFATHLLDTYLHYRVDGLSIQWHTPSFGGGLPAYANPQHMQFSLIQFLVFLFDPWTSIQIAIVLYASLGLLCFYLFAERILQLDWRASLLGSLFFVMTGFYTGHMISGQLGFLGFPLLSGIALVLFWRRWSDPLAGVVIALLVSSLIHQAGFYTLVIFALSCAIALPLLYLLDPGLFSFSSLIRRAATSLVCTLLISSSKLYAIYTLMQNFPRVRIQHSLTTFPSACAAFVAQLLGTTTIAPLMAISGRDVNLLPQIFVDLTLARFSGLWETDAAISPVLIGVLAVATFRCLRARRRLTLSDLSRGKRIALILLVVATWFSLEYALAKGSLHGLASRLPILQSLHISFRFTAAFHLPLAIVGAWILHRWFRRSTGRATAAFLLLNVLTLASLLSYFLYTEDVHYRKFDARLVREAYEKGREGETFPVTHVAHLGVSDWEVFAHPGATTLLPSEPIFGYGLEVFASRTRPGPVSKISSGFFNLTNPASLTSPETNGGDLFALFEESDRDRLEQFTRRFQPDWNLPALQVVSNVVSAISLCLALAIILLCPLVPFLTRARPQE